MKKRGSGYELNEDPDTNETKIRIRIKRRSGYELNEDPDTN